MKSQDKNAEILISSEPKEWWAEDSEKYYQARKTHLELLRLIPSQGYLILDVGCGPGTYGIILAREGNEVVGIDISSKATQVARKRAIGKGVNFYPLVGDLERLPFKDNCFDVCFCGYTLHHLPDINTAVAEFARIIKPGGRIALAEPNSSNPAIRFSLIIGGLLRRRLDKTHAPSPNEVFHKYKLYTEALEQHGFTDIRVNRYFLKWIPPLPAKTQKQGLGFLGLLLIYILTCLRHLLFLITAKLLPTKLSGTDLQITGIR